MITFGPISSIFDFATFAIMLGPFGAGPALFRSGWFVESLATQTLVVFVIRTHRVPFWRSRPSRPLLLAVFSVITIGALLPYSPFADDLGFTALPADFFAVLAGMVVLYLFLVELTKRRFFERVPAPAHPERPPELRRERRLQRRGSRWIHRPSTRLIRFAATGRHRRASPGITRLDDEPPGDVRFVVRRAAGSQPGTAHAEQGADSRTRAARHGEPCRAAPSESSIPTTTVSAIRTSKLSRT